MMNGRAARSCLAALVLVNATVVLIGAFCATPVGPLEEHFSLGQRLRATGSLGGAFLRPPGFPAFVAATLWGRDALAAAAGVARGDVFDDATTVIAAQRLALVLVSLFVFRQAVQVMSPWRSFCLAALLGVNPASFILSGTLSYQLLDMLLITLGTLALVIVFEPEAPSPRALLAGALWGLAALVRPVVLVLPAFVLGALLLRQGLWAGLRRAGWFALGMGLVVGPYTLRNFVLTGRLVPVCAQAGQALWGSTVAKPPPGQPYVSWVQIWDEQGMQIYTEVTGSRAFSIAQATAQAQRLDQEFARRALSNIERDPGIYLYNVANNLWRFPLDSSGWWWRYFLWVNAGRPAQGYSPEPASRSWGTLASGLGVGLSIAGLAGMLVGLRSRDPWALPTLIVYSALWIGHAVTFTIARYSYARLPLLILALGMLLRAPAPAASAPSIRSRLATALASTLVVVALASTLGLILARP